MEFGSHKGRNKIFTTGAHRPDIDTVYQLINQGTCSFLKSSFSNYKYNYYIKQFVKTLFYSGGMEHLSIFMWIKVHHNQNINRFRIFKSYNILLKILLKKFIFKNFLKRKKFKIPSGIPTHYLQICSEPSNLLRYAVRWQTWERNSL